jgi:uncharacterized repeat protein (TIGR02543 family)
MLSTNNATGAYLVNRTNVGYSNHGKNVVILKTFDSVINSCAISDSGQYISVAKTDGISVSSDYGANWISPTMPYTGDGFYAASIAMNSTGVKQTCVYGERICCSTNSGVTWAIKSTENVHNPNGISISPSGDYQLIKSSSTFNPNLRYSNNGGNTWRSKTVSLLGFHGNGASTLQITDLGKITITNASGGSVPSNPPDTADVIATDYHLYYGTITAYTAPATLATPTIPIITLYKSSISTSSTNFVMGGCAMSNDGKYRVAITNSDSDSDNNIYYSSDGGITYNKSSSVLSKIGIQVGTNPVGSIRMSKDGQYATTFVNVITNSIVTNCYTYASTDYGQTWSVINNIKVGIGDYLTSGFNNVYISGNGNYQLYSNGTNNLYMSSALTIGVGTIIGTTVTYNGNTNTGGIVPIDGSSPYITGDTVIVKDTESLTKTGYTFANWNTSEDGSGTGYSPTSTFLVNSNTILYAQWTQSV